MNEDQASKKILVATNKMFLPLEKYLNKQVKREKLEDNEILTVLLSTLVNVFTKAIILVNVILSARGKRVDINKIIDDICDNTKVYFEKAIASKLKKKEPIH